MRLFPKRMWRPLLLIALGVALVVWRLGAVRYPHRMHDGAQAMSAEQVELFD